jgi:crotonobetainyl-CoA:carnitine CoA-transferase CaiB-like acyl-CoA transferase
MTPCPVIARALDLPELAQYETNASMFEHRTTIYQTIAERLISGATEHWIKVLLAEDVWCAPVQDYDQLLHDPQAQHNEMFWDVEIGEGNDRFQTVGTPFVFSKTPAGIHRGVPDLGQHTTEVLGDYRARQ